MRFYLKLIAGRPKRQIETIYSPADGVIKIDLDRTVEEETSCWKQCEYSVNYREFPDGEWARLVYLVI